MSYRVKAGGKHGISRLNDHQWYNGDQSWGTQRRMLRTETFTHACTYAPMPANRTQEARTSLWSSSSRKKEKPVWLYSGRKERK